jgi:hypothetical protein
VIALRVGLAALLFDGSGRCSRRIESSPCLQGQHAALLQLTPGARRVQHEPACCRTSTNSAVGRERFDKPRPHARQLPRSADQSPPPVRVVGSRGRHRTQSQQPHRPDALPMAGRAHQRRRNQPARIHRAKQHRLALKAARLPGSPQRNLAWPPRSELEGPRAGLWNVNHVEEDCEPELLTLMRGLIERIGISA